MQFDYGSQEFVLNLGDRTLLQVPEEMSRWPKQEWSLLAEAVTRAQARTDGMDETLYPQGVMRNDLRSRILQNCDNIASMKKLISQHVEVDMSEIDTFFGER